MREINTTISKLRRMDRVIIFIMLYFLVSCSSNRQTPLPDLPTHFLIPTSPPNYNLNTK